MVFYPLAQTVRLHGITIPAGGFSLGYFWESLPFNVYHLFAPDGRSLAFYCNVSDRTRIDGGKIRWRDLVVDVLFEPGGDTTVLDEEDLPADLSADLRYYIDSARDGLLSEAERLTATLRERSRHYLADAP